MGDEELGGESAEIKNEGPSQDERTWALLGVLSPLAGFVIPIPFLGIIAPLVIYFMKREESDFVAFHALQTVYYGIALYVVGSIMAVLMIIALLTVIGLCVMIPLAIGVGIAAIVYEVMIAIKAHNGEWAEFWLVGEWARSSIGR